MPRGTGCFLLPVLATATFLMPLLTFRVALFTRFLRADLAPVPLRAVIWSNKKVQQMFFCEQLACFGIKTGLSPTLPGLR